MEQQDPSIIFTSTDRGGCRRDGKGGAKVSNGKVYFTPEGGLAVRFTAGEALSKGHVVYINQSGAADTVYKVPVDGDMPVGVCYESVAAGASVWSWCQASLTLCQPLR